MFFMYFYSHLLIIVYIISFFILNLSKYCINNVIFMFYFDNFKRILFNYLYYFVIPVYDIFVR